MAYSKNKNRSAVYCIKNITSGKIYIGSSVDYLERWNQHKKSLRKGNHYNKHLQRAWIKYGEASFIFGIIEYCTLELMPDIEMFHIRSMDAINPNIGYNVLDVYRGGKRKRPVCQYTLDGRLMFVWDTMKTASESLNIQVSGIVAACKGRIKHSGKFRWTYLSNNHALEYIGPIKKSKYAIHLTSYSIYGIMMAGLDLLGKWDSITLAGSQLNVDPSTIIKVINRKLFHWKGVIFVKSDSIDDARMQCLNFASSRLKYEIEDQYKNLSLGAKISAEKRKKKVKKINNDGSFEIFNSLKEAAESIDRIPSTVLSVIQGKTKTAGGYKWTYA